MSDHRDPVDDAIVKFGWWLIGSLIGFVVALLLGRWRKKQQEGQIVRFPASLEVDLDDQALAALATKPWHVRNAGCLLPVLGYFAVVSACGGLSAFSENIGGAFVLLLVATGIVYGILQLREEVKDYEGAFPTGAPIPPLNLENVPLYTISLPRSTAWEPRNAGHFMEQILHRAGRLTFQIVAGDGHIEWRILDHRQQLSPEAIRDTVHAFYPGAQVDAGVWKPEERPVPFHRAILCLEQAVDFLAPILAVEELAKADPLVNLTQEMSALNAGERVGYTLFVTDPARFVYAQAEAVLTVKPGITPFHFLSAQGWADAGYQLTAGDSQRLQRFAPEDQQVAETKLDNGCYQALLVIQIDAPTSERLQDLAGIATQVGQFRKFPYNTLIPHQWSETEGAVRVHQIKDIAQENRTNTVGWFADWLVNRDRSWQHFRLVLDTRELAALWHLPHEGFTAANIAWMSGRQVPLSNLMKGKREGVLLGFNRYAGQEEPVYVPDQDRQAHTLIIGKTGVGKSSLMHAMIHQDLKRGRGVAVIDPQGDLVADILRHSIPPEREDEVVVLDIANSVGGVHYPPPLNMLALPPGVDEDVAAGLLVAVIEKTYGQFALTEMADTLYHALLTLAAEPLPTVADVERVFDEPAYRNRLLDQLDNFALERYWQRFETAGLNQQGQWTRPVLRRLRPFYRNKTLYPVMCHPDPLDLGSLLAQNKIILVSLQTSEAQVPLAERVLLGAALVAQIQMAALAGAIQDGPFFLYVDETQHLVTSALDQMLSEARKRGLGLVLTNQYLKQLAGDTLDAVLGNVGAMVLFELGEPDAKAVAAHVKPEFAVADLVRLGNFKAALTLRYQGERLPPFSLETVAPPRRQDPTSAGEAEARIRRKSVHNYTPRSRQEVMDRLAVRYIASRRRPSTGEDDVAYSDPVH